MNKIYHVLQILQEPLKRRIFVSHLCQAFRYFTNCESLPQQIKFIWNNPQQANNLKCHLSVAGKSFLEEVPSTLHFARTFSSKSGKIKLSKNNAFSKISTDKYHLLTSTSKKKIKHNDMLIFKVLKNSDRISTENIRTDTRQQIIDVSNKNHNTIDLNKLKEQGKIVYESIVDKLTPIVSSDKCPKKTSSVRGPLRKPKSKQDVMAVIANKRSMNSHLDANESESPCNKEIMEDVPCQRNNDKSQESSLGAVMLISNQNVNNVLSVSNSKIYGNERDDRTQRKRHREKTNSFILSKENNNIKRSAKAKLFKKHQPHLDYHLKKLAEKYSKSSVAKTIKHLQNEYGNGAMKKPINEDIYRISDVKNKVLKHELKKKLETGIRKQVNRSSSNAYITAKPKVGLSNVFTSSSGPLNNTTTCVKESGKPSYAILTLDFKRDLKFKERKQHLLNAIAKEIQVPKATENTPTCNNQIIENIKNSTLGPKSSASDNNTKKVSDFDFNDGTHELYRPIESAKSVLTINIDGIVAKNINKNIHENNKETKNNPEGFPANQIAPLDQTNPLNSVKTDASKEENNQQMSLTTKGSSLVISIAGKKEDNTVIQCSSSKHETIKHCPINQINIPKEEMIKIVTESLPALCSYTQKQNQTITNLGGTIFNQPNNTINANAMAEISNENETHDQATSRSEKKECVGDGLKMTEPSKLELSKVPDNTNEKYELNKTIINVNDTENVTINSSSVEQKQSKHECKEIREYLPPPIKQLTAPTIQDKHENTKLNMHLGVLPSMLESNKNLPSNSQIEINIQGRENSPVKPSISANNSIQNQNSVLAAGKTIIAQNKKSFDLKNNSKNKPPLKESKFGNKLNDTYTTYNANNQAKKIKQDITSNLIVSYKFKNSLAKQASLNNKDKNQVVGPINKGQSYLSEELKHTTKEIKHANNLTCKPAVEPNSIKKGHFNVLKSNNKIRNTTIPGFSLPSSDNYVETDENKIKSLVDLKCIKTSNILKDLWNKNVDLPLSQRTFLLPKTNNLIMISSKNKINIDKKNISDCLSAIKSVQIQDLLFINPKLLITNLPSEIVGSINPFNKNVNSEVFMLLVPQNGMNHALYNKIIEFISNCSTNSNIGRTSLSNYQLQNAWHESKEFVTQGNIFLMHGPNKVSFHKVLKPSTFEPKQKEMMLNNGSDEKEEKRENKQNKEETLKESKEVSRQTSMSSGTPEIPAISADILIQDCEKAKKKQSSTEPLLLETDNTSLVVRCNSKIKEEKTPKTPHIINSKHMSSYTKYIDTNIQNDNFSEFIKLIDSFEIGVNKDHFSIKGSSHQTQNNIEKVKQISFSEFTNFVKNKREKHSKIQKLEHNSEIKNKTSILPSKIRSIQNNELENKNIRQKDKLEKFISTTKSVKRGQIAEALGVFNKDQQTSIKSNIALLKKTLTENKDEDVVNKYVCKLKSFKIMSDKKHKDYLTHSETEKGNNKKCCSPLKWSSKDKAIVKELNPMQKKENWSPKSAQLIVHSKYSSEAAGLSNNIEKNKIDPFLELKKNTHVKSLADQKSNSKSENINNNENESDNLKVNKDFQVGGSAHKLEINATSRAGEGDARFKLKIMYSMSPENYIRVEPVEARQQWNIVKLQPPTAKFSDLIKTKKMQCFDSLVKHIKEQEKLTKILELIKYKKSYSFKELIGLIENNQRSAFDHSEPQNNSQLGKNKFITNSNVDKNLALTHEHKNETHKKNDKCLGVNYLNKPISVNLNREDDSTVELEEATEKYLKQLKQKTNPILTDQKLKKINKIYEENIPIKSLEQTIKLNDFFSKKENNAYKTFNEILSSIKINIMKDLNERSEDKQKPNNLSLGKENNAYKTISDILTNKNILSEAHKCKEEKSLNNNTEIQNLEGKKKDTESVPSRDKTPKKNTIESCSKNMLQTGNQTLQTNKALSDTKLLSLPCLIKEFKQISLEKSESVENKVNHPDTSLRDSKIHNNITKLNKTMILPKENQSKINDLNSFSAIPIVNPVESILTDNSQINKTKQLKLNDINKDSTELLQQKSGVKDMIHPESNNKELSQIVKEIHPKEMNSTAHPLLSNQYESSKTLKSEQLKPVEERPIIDKLNIKLNIINETENVTSLSKGTDIKITGDRSVESGTLSSPSRIIKDQAEQIKKNQENNLAKIIFINETDLNVIVPAEFVNKLSIENVTRKPVENELNKELSNNNKNTNIYNTSMHKKSDEYTSKHNNHTILKPVANSNTNFFNFKEGNKIKRNYKKNEDMWNKKTKYHRMKCGSKMIHLITKQIKSAPEPSFRKNHSIRLQVRNQNKINNNQSKGFDRFGDSLQCNDVTQTSHVITNAPSQNNSVSGKCDNEGFISQSLRSESIVLPSSILFSGKTNKEQKKCTTPLNIKFKISKYRQNKKEERHFQTCKSENRKDVTIKQDGLTSSDLQQNRNLTANKNLLLSNDNSKREIMTILKNASPYSRAKIRTNEQQQTNKLPVNRLACTTLSTTVYKARSDFSKRKRKTYDECLKSIFENCISQQNKLQDTIQVHKIVPQARESASQLIQKHSFVDKPVDMQNSQENKIDNTKRILCDQSTTKLTPMADTQPNIQVFQYNNSKDRECIHSINDSQTFKEDNLGNLEKSVSNDPESPEKANLSIQTQNSTGKEGELTSLMGSVVTNVKTKLQRIPSTMCKLMAQTQAQRLSEAVKNKMFDDFTIPNFQQKLNDIQKGMLQNKEEYTGYFVLKKSQEVQNNENEIKESREIVNEKCGKDLLPKKQTNFQQPQDLEYKHVSFEKKRKQKSKVKKISDQHQNKKKVNDLVKAHLNRSGIYGREKKKSSPFLAYSDLLNDLYTKYLNSQLSGIGISENSSK